MGCEAALNPLYWLCQEDRDRWILGSLRNPSGMNPLATGDFNQRLNGEVDAEGIHPPITAHKHIPTMHQRNRLDDRQPQPMVIATVAA